MNYLITVIMFLLTGMNSKSCFTQSTTSYGIDTGIIKSDKSFLDNSKDITKDHRISSLYYCYKYAKNV